MENLFFFFLRVGVSSKHREVLENAILLLTISRKEKIFLFFEQQNFEAQKMVLKNDKKKIDHFQKVLNFVFF